MIVQTTKPVILSLNVKSGKQLSFLVFPNKVAAASIFAETQILIYINQDSDTPV